MQRNKKVEAVHYDATPVETIEIIESIVNREQIPRRAAFAIGNAVKYLCRAGLKEFENWEDCRQGRKLPAPCAYRQVEVIC